MDTFVFMLVDRFYTVEFFENSSAGFVCGVIFPAGHEIYQGHFPGQPVVPGVLQIQTVRELTEKAVGRVMFINEVVSAKYLRMIVPGVSVLRVEAVLKGESDAISLTAVIKDAESVYSKLKIRLTTKKPPE